MQNKFWVFVLVIVSSSSLAKPSEIILLRHLHKLAGDNPALSPCGLAQANAIKTQLDQLTISNVWHTPYKRTTETAQLITKPDTRTHLYEAKQLISLKQQVLAQNHTVLVVGHSNTVPEIVKDLSGDTIKIGENDYGTLYRMNWIGEQWVLQQQPLRQLPTECNASASLQ